MYTIHSKTGVSLPRDQREQMKRTIANVGYLTSVEKEAVIAHLDRLPLKLCACHGDPNPGNLMIDHRGKAVVIDWMGAANGNPEADLAEYIVMIRYGVLPPEMPGFLTDVFNAIRGSVVDILLDEYTQLSSIHYEEIEPWIPIVAARKLSASAISDAEKQVLADVIRQSLRGVGSDAC